jgi:DNA polymerase-3 subunit delta'
LKQYLQKLAESSLSSRSFLFAGADKKLKEQEALSFAKALLKNSDKIEAGNHPDLHIYKPEGKIGLHSIASIRKLIDEVYLPPLEAPCKVFIVTDADRMLATSANALLKTFEEPAERTIIILIASSPHNLLQTIVSRCQTLYFPCFDTVFEEEPLLLRILSLLTTRKSYPEFLQEIKSIALELESSKISDEAEKTLYVLTRAQNILNLILQWFRDAHLVSMKGNIEYLFFKDKLDELITFSKRSLLPLSKVQKVIEESKNLLNRSVSLVIVLENTFLKLL